MELQPIPAPRSPRLLDRVREALRVRHKSPRTEEAYVGWIRRFIFFHGKRHPDEMGEAEIAAFLTHLAVERHVAASTQTQALSALLFLYGTVLGRELAMIDGIVRAHVPRRLPVVLTRNEVRAVLERLDGVYRLIAILLYGSGLRLLECLRLRVKDVDFEAREIRVRSGKGDQDRVTMLPESAIEPMLRHLEGVRLRHRSAIERGAGAAPLPGALVRKYPSANREWAWQFVFPASRDSREPRTGEFVRFHIHPTAVQREVHAAVRRARITKPAACHTFRHYSESRIMPSKPVLTIGMAGDLWPCGLSNSA